MTKELISPKSQLERGRTILWPQGVYHQRAYQSVPSSFMLRKEGEMRVRQIRTFGSHILSKNKPVLLGQTALRLWLYNLIRLSSLFLKKSCIKTATSKCQGPTTHVAAHWYQKSPAGRHYWSSSAFHCKPLVITNCEVPHINRGGKTHLLGLLKNTRCCGPEFEADGDVDCTVPGAEDGDF